MGEHAKFSPSAAKRWLKCPASIKESEGCTQPDSEHSLRGTAGHWAFAEMLQDREVTIGMKAPNGVVITEELLEAAGEGVGWARKYISEHPGCSVAVEERVQIGAYFGLDPELFYGTCDLRIMSREELVVFDLKLGFVDVQAEENPQLLSYAGGLAEELGWLWDKYRLVICQPRQGEPKEWEITRVELQKRLEEFREPIANALSDSPRYNPCEEACTEGYCPAVAKCPRLHEEQVALAKMEFTAFVEEGDKVTVAPHVTVEQMADVLKRADFIRAALSAMEAKALSLLMLGQDIPGYKVVEGKKNRVWKPGAEEKIVEKLGKERAYKKTLITPAQAEKLDKSLATLSEKPKGEPRLAPITDKRPALPAHFDSLEIEEGDVLS